jgi:hypothetical protein
MKNSVESRSLSVAEFHTNGIGNSNVLEIQRLTDFVHALISYELHQGLLEQVLSIDAKNSECVHTSLGDSQIRFS